MGIANAANGAATAIPTHLSTQRGQGRVDGPDRPGGNVGGVAAQASFSIGRPPQNRSISIPVVATVDLARQHDIARAYVFDIPTEKI